MPTKNFIDEVQTELNWKMRSILLDWLVNVHLKFRLLPETLFLTVNIIDRFLSVRSVSISKLQLVGVTAMFIASKYEEVYAPSVSQFAYITDNGFSTDDICKAERYLLSALNFGLHFPNPLHFLRRASKADDYDSNTRTMAKYFLEVAMFDQEFLMNTPSILSAAFMFAARLIMGKKNPWNATIQYYSGGYELEELQPIVVKLIMHLREPQAFQSVVNKYATSKYAKVSLYAEKWAKEFVAEQGLNVVDKGKKEECDGEEEQEGNNENDEGENSANDENDDN